MEDKEKDWKFLYQDLFQSNQKLGQDYRDVKEALDRIEPIYKKLYWSGWWYWFIRPIDAQIDKKILRCVGRYPGSPSCNKVFILGSQEEKDHVGKKHWCRQELETNVWEYIKLRWLKW